MNKDAILDRAAEQCAARGAQLTPLRRQVLRLVLTAEQPMGAYALLDRLREERGVAAPPTVYRALDFLLEQGLIHKLERLSAFIGCVADPHEHEGHGHAHAAQFLICRRCHKVTEIEDSELAHALTDAANRLGFTVAGATIEAEGLCAACQP